MADDVSEWVLASARQMADDHGQGPNGPFSSRNHLLSFGAMVHPEQAIEDAIGAYLADGTFLGWHGLLVPADDDRLRAVIEWERGREIPRTILIGKCNKYLAGEIAEFIDVYQGAVP